MRSSKAPRHLDRLSMLKAGRRASSLSLPTAESGCGPRGRPVSARGFVLHAAGAAPTRHLTLLGAMKAAAVLAQAGARGVRVEDLGRRIAWRLMRVRRSRGTARRPATETTGSDRR